MRRMATDHSGPPLAGADRGGLVLAPFRGLRYDPARADLTTVTSPPYDVIDADGVRALEQSSEHNVVRLILPRDEERAGDRYARAVRTLEGWRASGVLTVDALPGLYVYEQASATHAQRGLLGALALSPASDGIVLPHENTMSGTVSDRLALYTAVDADLEPVFLVYAGGGAASALVAGIEAREPLVDVTLPDGLRHRLWAVTDAQDLAAVRRDLRPRSALIADGHHRYETYLQRQAAAHAAGRGPGPWDSGLVFLVDDTAFGPEVHPIHRVVAGRDVEELAQAATSAASVDVLDGKPLEEAVAALSRAGAGGPAYLLASGDATRLRLVSGVDPGVVDEALPRDRSEAWRGLDVTVLHHVVIPRLWQVEDDPETVRFEHDTDAALATARTTGGTAVLLNATSASAVAAVAAAGDRMPRKSTLFTPKPRTGLVLRDHRDA